MPTSLGTFIRERRQDLGLTQKDLATRIDPSLGQAYISRLEQGSIDLPRRERLEAIAAALDVSLGELLLRSGWVTAGDRLAAAMHNVAKLSTLDLRYPHSIADLADVVADLQEMLAEATRTILQAAETVAIAQEAVQLTGQAIGVLAGPGRDHRQDASVNRVLEVGHDRSDGQDPEEGPNALPNVADGG